MTHRRLTIFSILLVVLMTAVSVFVLMRVSPGASVPVHWNLAGEADRYAPAWLAMAIAPGIAAMLALVFWAWPRLEPRRTNLERSGRFYRVAWMATLGLMGLVHGVLAAVALGAAIPVPLLSLSAAGVLVIVIGNWLGKSRSNFLIGVRTPWTLSSETAWIKTNRLTGKLLMAYGGLFLIMPLLGLTGTGFLIVCVGGAVAILLVSVVYSYRVWRLEAEQEIE